MDVFLEKFRRGGGGGRGGVGVISDPKNYIADFVGFKPVYFLQIANLSIRPGVQ